MTDRPASSPTGSPGRLLPGQIRDYRDNGYLIFREPVLRAERFAGLKSYFERLLAELPAATRPEAMDVPHFMHPQLLDWAFDADILDIVAPIVGPDIALFSTHFICKPKGNGRRVPWHEDSAYWRGSIEPMEVCTVWLAIDPSTRMNGCMKVIPRTHREGQKGFSDYNDVDRAANVFPTEIRPEQREDARAVYLELEPNQCSLHDARIQHGSEPNTSPLRRCGWTLRFCPTSVRFNQEKFAGGHQVYLARGSDRGGNVYADPKRSYPELMAIREAAASFRNSH
jgi:hypothetical protein